MTKVASCDGRNSVIQHNTAVDSLVTTVAALYTRLSKSCQCVTAGNFAQAGIIGSDMYVGGTVAEMVWRQQSILPLALCSTQAAIMNDAPMYRATHRHACA